MHHHHRLALCLALASPASRWRRRRPRSRRALRATPGGEPAFTAFSAERGRQFFTTAHGRDWSCASCHSANPAAAGKHATTGKSITALAPAANAERFTSLAKVDKWFKRNCNDVAGRDCSAQEKGDVLAWLLAQR